MAEFGALTIHNNCGDFIAFFVACEEINYRSLNTK